MQPVTIAQLLKRQPHLFDGRVEPLGHIYINPEFYERANFEARAGRMLRRKFDFAARGILLRSALDTIMYELPPEECTYHQSHEDRWSPEKGEVVSYTIFDAENMERIRGDIIQAAQFLCDGTEQYRRLLAGHCAHIAKTNGIKAVSDEVVETKILSETLERLAQKLNFDFEPGF
jgi:hypothetical protein